MALMCQIDRRLSNIEMARNTSTWKRPWPPSTRRASSSFMMTHFRFRRGPVKLASTGAPLEENSEMRYNDVMMGTMTSQNTSLTIVYSTVYSGADQRKHKISESLALWGEFTDDRSIPRTKDQWRWKCFHLMTSRWEVMEHSGAKWPVLRLLHWCLLVVFFKPQIRHLQIGRPNMKSKGPHLKISLWLDWMTRYRLSSRGYGRKCDIPQT